MPPKHPPRPYYDHEPAYEKILAKGGKGWLDIYDAPGEDAYCAIDTLLASPHCPAPSPGLQVIDLGCGGGQVALRLAEHGYDATGVEFSESAVKLARANARERGLDARFEVGNCHDLKDFRDGTFGLAIDHHVLHCVVGAADRQRFLRTAARVLAPGGLFFSETMTAEGEIDLEHSKIDPVTRVTAAGNRVFVLRSELEAELLEAGFEVLEMVFRTPPTEVPTGDMLITFARKPSRTTHVG